MLGDQHTQLLIEPIMGWRSWSVKEINGRPSFVSPQQNTPWDRGRLDWDGECRCERSRSAASRMWRQHTEWIRRDRERSAGEDNPERQTRLRMLKELGDPEQCHCGINAFAHAGQLIDGPHLFLTANHAVGQVALSGMVRGYERGWRAERAQVMRVWANSDANSFQQYAPNLVEAAAKEAGVQFMGTVDDAVRGAWWGMRGKR